MVGLEGGLARADDHPFFPINARQHRRHLDAAVPPMRGQDGAVVGANERAGLFVVHGLLLPVCGDCILPVTSLAVIERATAEAAWPSTWAYHTSFASRASIWPRYSGFGRPPPRRSADSRLGTAR